MPALYTEWVSDAGPRERLDHTLLLLALVALIGVSLSSLGTAGLVGPDEPRYASIGREMALSGDWITPRLWGSPWFEKPPLLYWLIALAHRAGLRDELAARLPCALCGAGFLVFYWWALRRLGRACEASVAVVLLAATAGWMAVGNVAATDMPLTASFNACLLAALLWLDTGRRRWAVIAGAFLGLALLAKGLVGTVLFLPVLWFARRRIRGLLLLFTAAALVAMPWYAAVTAQYGMEFIRVFFLEHHFGRFIQPNLQHVQPFWFYVPVLLGLVFPWTPMFALVRRSTFREQPERVCAAVAVFGFVFFSIATNKLPGYLLPILPAVCLLLARAVVESEAPRRALAACGWLLFLMPVAAAALPGILLVGLRRTTLSVIPWEYLAPVAAAALGAWWLAKNGGTGAAIALLALFTAAGWLEVKLVALPVVDRVVSARSLWRQVEPHRGDVCVESLNRSLRYGLNYYSVTPLPDCSIDPRPYRITQAQAQPPILTAPQPSP